MNEVRLGPCKSAGTSIVVPAGSVPMLPIEWTPALMHYCKDADLCSRYVIEVLTALL